MSLMLKLKDIIPVYILWRLSEKLIQSYLPAFRQKKRKLSKEENIDFRYDIVVKDARKVLKALYPQFNISEGSKIAAYYGKDKAIHLKMNADTLQYRDFCLTASEINMEGDAERLQLVYTADKFEYGICPVCITFATLWL